MAAAMKFHLSQLRKEESSMLEIPTVHTWVWWGREERCSHTTQDLQTHAPRLIDRFLDEEGEGHLKKQLQKTPASRGWRFPRGKGDTEDSPGCSHKDRISGNWKGHKPSVAVNTRARTRIGWFGLRRCTTFHHFLLSSNFICRLGLGDQEMLLFFKHYCIIMGY